MLLATVLVLMNLEKTFRSAVGTMRWRIKFIVLGLVIVFGARIYTLSQGLLFSGQVLALTDVDTAALLIGSALMAVAFLRSGFGEIDVYPSHAVLRTSLTVLLVGAYLFIVGSKPSSCCWDSLSWLCYRSQIGPDKISRVSLAAISRGRSMISARYGRALLNARPACSISPACPLQLQN